MHLNNAELYFQIIHNFFWLKLATHQGTSPCDYSLQIVPWKVCTTWDWWQGLVPWTVTTFWSKNGQFTWWDLSQQLVERLVPTCVLTLSISGLVHILHFCHVKLNSIKCGRNATVDSYVTLVSNCRVCQSSENIFNVEYSIFWMRQDQSNMCLKCGSWFRHLIAVEFNSLNWIWHDTAEMWRKSRIKAYIS